MSFDAAIRFTLRHEGGFNHHPNDPGGATNYGISLRALKQAGDAALAVFDVDQDGELTPEDMRMMRREDAIEHYREHYWSPRYDAINSPRMAIKLFDMGVNMGRHQAVTLLQRALQVNRPAIVDDGIFGPITLAATNGVMATHPNQMMQELQNQQARFYFGLVNENAQRRPFLVGWLRRAYSDPHNVLDSVTPRLPA